MNKLLPALTFICLISFTSCARIEKFKSTSRPFSSLKVPLGFNWKNSRYINITVNISDTRFGNSLYTLAVYNGDPKAGGKLMVSGAASNSAAYETRINLSNQISFIYIVKTSPDNSTVNSKIAVGTASVNTTMGQ